MICSLSVSCCCSAGHYEGEGSKTDVENTGDAVKGGGDKA